MKKLMVALAAVACGAVFADGIESSNICGYQNVLIPEGCSMITPTFKNVDGSKIDLSSITIVGDGLGKCMGAIEVQLISAGGEWLGDYYYYNGKTKAYPNVGWYDADDEFLEGGLDFLEPGEAIFINNDQGEDIYFQFAGEVEFGSANPLPEGCMQTGNSSPVDIDLQDFVPAGEGLGKCMGGIEMQTISPAGVWDGDYYYYNGQSKAYPNVGWYDADDEFVEIGTVILTAGKGTFINNDQGEDIYMSVPDPVGTSDKE